MFDYARRKEQELNESNGNNENLQAQIDSLKKKIRELEVCFSAIASPQTSFEVRLSRIHFYECVTNEPQRTSAGRLSRPLFLPVCILYAHGGV